MSKKHPFSCLSTTDVERHESLNFLKIGQETLNYLASNITIFESKLLSIFYFRTFHKNLYKIE
ncbi:hypothetical protein C6359_28915 [Bacillus wiedmannii]|nr:hypothetical protein C6358_28880 [Bacillus wiedmannii]PRT38582.1 hypothetical protein C6359_28915 [Bacillus wiedmannii]